MINTENDSNKEVESNLREQKPNDYSSMYIRNFLKITDPDSGEVILETAN